MGVCVFVVMGWNEMFHGQQAMCARGFLTIAVVCQVTT